MATASTTPTDLAVAAPDKSRAVSRSVSLPAFLWDIIDATGDRSRFIRPLVEKELRAQGKLPGSAENALVEQFAELVSDEAGKKTAAALLEEIASRKAELELQDGGRRG